MYEKSREWFQNIQGFSSVAQDSNLVYSTSVFISLHRDRSKCWVTFPL